MKKRLLSIDVLRGMTIFFMIVVNTPGTWKYVYGPLRHAEWDGWTSTDLVFPFFVFIMGLAMSFSFTKYSTNRKELIEKIVKRTLAIFLVGLLLNWYPFFNKSLSELRIFGVLQRIALAYGLGGMIILLVRRKYLPACLAIILLGYWGLLYWGGSFPGPLTLENNLVRIVDLALFGEKHIYQGYGIPFDPEGLVSSLPAAGTVILAYLVGKRIQELDEHITKIKELCVAGVILVLMAYVWHFIGFPINKPLWSSSYVLLTGGLAMLLFALLIWLIDVKELRAWTYVFRVFGLNPLISYVLSGLVIKTFFMIDINDQNVYAWLYSNIFQASLGNYLGSLTQALAYTFFIWFFAWLLYRKAIVIKL